MVDVSATSVAFVFIFCLYWINWLVCYKVEELRSSYGAKVQRVFLTFSFGVFLQKNVKMQLEKKVCGNKTIQVLLCEIL